MHEIRIDDPNGLFQLQNTMKYCRGLVWALQHKDKSTSLNKSQRGIFYLSNLLYENILCSILICHFLIIIFLPQKCGNKKILLAPI